MKSIKRIFLGLFFGVLVGAALMMWLELSARAPELALTPPAVARQATQSKSWSLVDGLSNSGPETRFAQSELQGFSRRAVASPAAHQQMAVDIASQLATPSSKRLRRKVSDD